MIKYTIRIIVILIFTITSSNAQSTSSSDKSEITKVLMMQKDSWNKGNIEEYMRGYWKSDSLKFVGKKGITFGWKQTLNNYKKGYPDKETMGILEFTVISIESLSSEKALMIGKWELERKKGNIEGYFTLIWKKFSKGWKIIVDHTS